MVVDTGRRGSVADGAAKVRSGEYRAGGEGQEGATRTGRPRVTSRAALERLGFELFARQGFDATTVDDIAAAAGIGRRTFFRYFASKNDLVWGDFEDQLRGFEELLAATDPAVPMMDALRGVVVEFNRFDPEVVPWHRQRMTLILRVPTLQADSTVRYTTWRALVTEFAARRMGRPVTDLPPRLLGHAALAACIAAYEYWLTDSEVDLGAVLDQAMRQVAAGFDGGVSGG
ncbi:MULTISPECIES: mycofactocin system transcriptional regulator [Streptomyces]|uniref:Mycofactocin system transcriptional regulator n=1 Tax=Streptomyces turgidiscabies (strain Car8) TaxID=698760 RepID=L7F0F8_STRT8|nr:MULTISPECIES: mycofactocin system transcriptional regulator [Streptomyces]ELP65153.1 mycofactocin system transcriptional regulator [Streptomyces turgidiscabies Car8]MDX3494576.1 mycofactocin system transcriptional regulator [Streptomyces turgidiscabies]